MQRTFSLNTHEYGLILISLNAMRVRFFLDQDDLTDDELKMKTEQIDRLIKRLNDVDNTPVGGVFIDGERA